MKSRGSALAQMVFAILFLLIIATALASQTRVMIPTVLLLIGPVLIVMGLVVREQSISAVGIMLLALAIVYANSVL